MKIQIRRFSPHQNAKVISILMAVSSLVLFVPLYLLFVLVPPEDGQARPPVYMLLVFPLVYLVMGYVMVAIACAIYNLVARYTGGIEYDTEDGAA